jgi:opacity protein-like surface antigen
MHRLSTSLAACALVALLAAPGASANQSVFGLGFHGGYGQSEDADSGSGRAGIHAELRPFHSLGFVGSAGYVFEEDVLVTDTDGEEVGTFKAKNTPVTAMARVYLPVPNFHPYAAAGASWNFLTYDTGDGIDDIQLSDDSETAFGWLLGAGAQYDASDKLGFFGEMRWEFIDAERKLDDETGNQIEDFDYNRWNALAGLTFYF